MTVCYDAKYTMPLYQLLEMYCADYLCISIDEAHKLPVSEIIKNSKHLLFDFDYPMWRQEYKDIFETNFCNYFYTYEIGAETIKLFKQRLMSELLVKMPYYNLLYDSTTWMEKYDVNPVANTDVTETFTRTNTGENKTKANNNSTGKTESYSESLDSDTPQGPLSGLDNYASALARNKAVSDSTGDSTSNSSSNDYNKEEFQSRKLGNIGVQTFADIIMSNRNAFINVDLMVFGDLRNLFMLIL